MPDLRMLRIDFGFLENPRTLRFSDINRKSIPDEGVVVA